MNFLRVVCASLLVGLLMGGCGTDMPNNPYPAGEAMRQIFYTTYVEPPKTLDPAKSYSSDEYDFIGVVYDPPLQYHLLSQRIWPNTATEVPVPKNQVRLKLVARVNAVSSGDEIGLDLGAVSGVAIGQTFAVHAQVGDGDAAKAVDVPAQVISVGPYHAVAKIKQATTDAGEAIKFARGMRAEWEAPHGQWVDRADHDIRNHLDQVEETAKRETNLKNFRDAVNKGAIDATQAAPSRSSDSPVVVYFTPDWAADFSVRLEPGWRIADEGRTLAGPNGVTIAVSVDEFDPVSNDRAHPANPDRLAFLRDDVDKAREALVTELPDSKVVADIGVNAEFGLMPGRIVAVKSEQQPTGAVVARVAGRNKHFVFTAKQVPAAALDATTAGLNAMLKTAWSTALAYPFAEVRVVYDIRIQPGILYAPHPCFARERVGDLTSPESLKILNQPDDARRFLYHPGIKDTGAYNRLRELRQLLGEGRSESDGDVRTLLAELHARGVDVAPTLDAVVAKLDAHGHMMTETDVSGLYDIGDFDIVTHVGVVLAAPPAITPEKLAARGEAARAEMTKLFAAKKFAEGRVKHIEAMACESLARRLRWDEKSLVLTWDGRMQPSERDELLSFAPGDATWRDTVAHLYLQSQQVATRELVAADYVNQIKRLASPLLHCPIVHTIGQYIVGLEKYTEELDHDLHAERERRRARAGMTYSQEVDERDNPILMDLDAHELAGVEVVDKYTYRVVLSEPWPQFKYWLAMPFFSPMPWEAESFFQQSPMANNDLTLTRFPVGTGPYRFSIYDRTREIRLVRNENYRRESYPTRADFPDDPNYPNPVDVEAGLLADEGRVLPFLEEVVFKLEKEAVPRWHKFLQGYYDTSGVSESVFQSAVGNSGDSLVISDQMKARGMRMNRNLQVTNYYFGFNMRDKKVGGYTPEKRKLRQAIAIALDIEGFIENFRNGLGEPAHSPIPPMVLDQRYFKNDYNPYVYDWDASADPWRPEVSAERGAPKRKSIEEAKKLLAEAGYPDGKDKRTGAQLTIHFDNTWVEPARAPWLAWMKKCLSELGIVFESRSTDYNRFQDKVDSGNFEMFFWGWNNDYPDPENNLFLLYGPNHRTPLPWEPSSGENAANYANPRFDELFQKMKTMSDDFDGDRNGVPDRVEMIKEMIEILRQDSPWVFGWHPVNLALYHGWLFNTKFNAMSNNSLKYYRLDVQSRNEYRREVNQTVVWPVVVLAILLVLAAIPAMIGAYMRENQPQQP